MPIDETVRKYQTAGKPVTNKTDSHIEPVTSPSQSVSVQFDDVKKQELSHGDCPGCMY